MTDLSKPRCEHLNFNATVNVGRLTEKDGAPVTGYTADVRIKCRECGLPFVFVGINAGYSPRHPMASVDGQEARLPIRPKDSRIFPAIPGFEVRAQ